MTNPEIRVLNFHLMVNSIMVFVIYGIALFIVNSPLVEDVSMSETIRNYAALGGLFSAFYFMYAWGRLTGMFFNPFSVFMVAFYIFSFGQPLLEALNVDFSSMPTVNTLAFKYITEAVLYSLLCFNAFFLGALLNLKFEKKTVLATPQETATVIHRIKTVGLIIFAVTFIPVLSGRLISTLSSADFSYASLRVGSEFGIIYDRISTVVGGMFMLSLMLLLIAYSKKRYMLVIIYSVAMVIVITNMMYGERSEMMAAGLVLLWYHRYYVSKNKVLNNALLAGSFIAIVLLVPVMGAMRNSGLVTLDVILDFVAVSGREAMTSTLSVAGYSLFPLVMTMELIPAYQGFGYGSSFLASLTSIVPNFVGGRHIAAQYGDLSTWLMKELDMGFGPGFSIPAEVYYNFGWFPIPILLILGFIFGRFLTPKKGDYVRLVVVMMFFFLNVTRPRREFLGAARSFFYMILPIYIFLQFGVSGIRKVVPGQGKLKSKLAKIKPAILPRPIE